MGASCSHGRDADEDERDSTLEVPTNGAAAAKGAKKQPAPLRRVPSSSILRRQASNSSVGGDVFYDAQTNFAPALDAKTEAALAEMKRLLSEAGVELTSDSPLVIAGDVDATLRRFLNACKNDAKAGAQKLRDTLKWRADNNVDGIFEEQPSASGAPLAAMAKHCPFAYHGEDKSGRPIYFDLSGRGDVAAAMAEGVTKEQLIRLHVLLWEYQTRYLMRDASKKAGRTIDSMLNVADLSGASSRLVASSALAMASAAGAIDTAHYPGLVNASLLVNAPRVFTPLWSVMSRAVEPEAREKVELFRTGAPTRTALRARVRASCLPVELGGTCAACGAVSEGAGKRGGRTHCLLPPPAKPGSGRGAAPSDGLLSSQRAVREACAAAAATKGGAKKAEQNGNGHENGSNGAAGDPVAA